MLSLGVMTFDSPYEQLSRALDQQRSPMGFDLSILKHIGDPVFAQAEQIWKDVDEKYFKDRDTPYVDHNIIADYMVRSFPGLSRKACHFIVNSLGWDYH